MAVILVDMDGVLADFEGYRATLMRAMGHPVPPTVETFYGRETYARMFGEPLALVAEGITLVEGFFRNLPLIPGGIEGVRRLQSSGHDVRICSSPLRRNPHCRDEKLEWLRRHLGSDWADEATITSVKSEVVGDYLIDDRPDLKRGIKPDEWSPGPTSDG